MLCTRPIPIPTPTPHPTYLGTEDHRTMYFKGYGPCDQYVGLHGVEWENSQKLLIGEYIKRNEMKQKVNEIL